MSFESILCRALKNIVVFEDGLKLGGEEVSDLLSSDIYFEGEIGDKFEGKKTVSGIKYGKREST